MKEIFEFYNEIKDIRYGWHDKEGNIHESLKGHKENFIQQDVDTILKDRYAICVEMCEVQREFFNKHNIDNKTIMIYLETEKGIICHTFSVFYKNNKVYWFEASWKNKKGIHEFNSLEEVLEYYKYNFQDFAGENYDKSKIHFIDYDGIKPGMTTTDYMLQCQKCKVIM